MTTLKYDPGKAVPGHQVCRRGREQQPAEEGQFGVRLRRARLPT